MGMSKRVSSWPLSAIVGLITCFILAPLSGVARAGQDAAGSIYGLVTDESGAVLPGVTVRATSPSLQVSEILVVTEANGEYRMTPLPIGIYRVEYSLQGFQAVRQED